MHKPTVSTMLRATLGSAALLLMAIATSGVSARTLRLATDCTGEACDRPSGVGAIGSSSGQSTQSLMRGLLGKSHYHDDGKGTYGDHGAHDHAGMWAGPWPRKWEEHDHHGGDDDEWEEHDDKRPPRHGRPPMHGYGDDGMADEWPGDGKYGDGEWKDDGRPVRRRRPPMGKPKPEYMGEEREYEDGGDDEQHKPFMGKPKPEYMGEEREYEDGGDDKHRKPPMGKPKPEHKGDDGEYEGDDDKRRRMS